MTDHDKAAGGEAQALQRLYPTWVSEGTCSTKCVDMRNDEEFCVATSACEHVQWRRSFDKHHSLIDGFQVSSSLSHCDVWGGSNRCDGGLCDVDHEC